MIGAWCVVLLKRHSSIVRVPSVRASIDTIPSSALSSQEGARGKPQCPRTVSPGDYRLTISRWRHPQDARGRDDTRDILRE